MNTIKTETAQLRGRTPSGSRAEGRTYGGESSEERSLRRRQRFIEAGHELFGTIGYRKTTMRTLCKTAELTDRYFYESFSSMEDLLVAVYGKLIGEMQAQVLLAVQGVAQRDDAAALIDAGLDAFFRAVEDPRSARVVWLEVLGVSPRVDALYNETLRGFALIFLGLAQSVYPQWRPDEARDRIIAIGIIGAVSQVTMDWLLSDYKAPRAAMVEAMATIIRGLTLVVSQEQD